MIKEENSKLAAESFIVKAEGARGELATCYREVDKINEKIVDLVMQNKGGILSFIHLLSLEKLKIKRIFRWFEMEGMTIIISNGYHILPIQLF